MSWGAAQRLAFIESRLFWEEKVNRGDLVAAFGISVPQASKDLTLYQQEAPANLRYDKARKCYVAAHDFAPRFIEPEADAYLSSLPDAVSLRGAGAVHLPIPRRPIDADVLRAIVAAARTGGSIEIRYQSMVADRVGPSWRRISPHAFAHDGTRWHVRAYCHQKNAFLDFILSRCLATRDPAADGMSSVADLSWHTEIPVVLAPNPALTPGQQTVVAEDYGMRGGEVVLTVRQALLAYFDKRMRLDLTDHAANPREASVIVKNKSIYEDALRRADPRPD